MGRMYSVSFEGVVVTVVQDFFECLPADDKPVILHGLYLSQSSDVGDAAEEILRVKALRATATVTSGLGGTVASPVAANEHDAAAAAAWEVNNTTLATTTGALKNLLPDNFNIRVGWQIVLPPEMRPIFFQGEAFILRLIAAPVDALTMSGAIFFEEL